MLLLKIRHRVRCGGSLLSELLDIVLQLFQLDFCIINGFFLILDDMIELLQFVVEPRQCGTLFLELLLCFLVRILQKQLFQQSCLFRGHTEKEYLAFLQLLSERCHLLLLLGDTSGQVLPIRLRFLNVSFNLL